VLRLYQYGGEWGPLVPILAPNVQECFLGLGRSLWQHCCVQRRTWNCVWEARSDTIEGESARVCLYPRFQTLGVWSNSAARRTTDGVFLCRIASTISNHIRPHDPQSLIRAMEGVQHGRSFKRKVFNRMVYASKFKFWVSLSRRMRHCVACCCFW
jgi:hypothetical protein